MRTGRRERRRPSRGPAAWRPAGRRLPGRVSPRPRRPPTPGAEAWRGGPGRTGSCGYTDRPFRAQLRDPVRTQAEFAVDLLVVLAEPPPREADRSRAVGQAEHDILHLQRPEVLVLDRRDRVDRLHLRVLHQLLDVVDGCDRRAGQVEGRHDIVEIARANPGAQDAVKLVAVVDALSGGLEPRLLGDVGPPGEPPHPLR